MARAASRWQTQRGKLARFVSQENLRKIWSVPLGPSYSGPIVVGDRVFTTETMKRKSDSVKAFDSKTGKQLWSTEWLGAMSVPFFAKSNGDWIRSTPAYDDGRLYVAGMRDVLVCLDANDGKQIWKVDFPEKFGTPVPSFGFVCSPLDRRGCSVCSGRWRFLQTRTK